MDFPSDTYLPTYLFLLDHYMNLEIHLVGPYESIKRNMFLGWLYVNIKSLTRENWEKSEVMVCFFPSHFLHKMVGTYVKH